MECCLGKVSRFAWEKNDYERFYELFGRRLKLGNHEDSTYRTNVAEFVAVWRSEVW